LLTSVSCNNSAKKICQPIKPFYQNRVCGELEGQSDCVSSSVKSSVESTLARRLPTLPICASTHQERLRIGLSINVLTPK